jgi:hypothetical protein
VFSFYALLLCASFMLTHLHGFVNRKKARRTGIFHILPIRRTFHSS